MPTPLIRNAPITHIRARIRITMIMTSLVRRDRIVPPSFQTLIISASYFCLAEFCARRRKME